MMNIGDPDFYFKIMKYPAYLMLAVFFATVIYSMFLMVSGMAKSDQNQAKNKEVSSIAKHILIFIFLYVLTSFVAVFASMAISKLA